jgi:hypothetical protein
MGKACSQPAKQIENEISEMAEPVLYVVAEDDQEPHVSEQVQPGRVQEHGGECGYDGQSRWFRTHKPGVYAQRHKTKLEFEAGSLSWRERDLI